MVAWPGWSQRIRRAKPECSSWDIAQPRPQPGAELAGHDGDRRLHPSGYFERISESWDADTRRAIVECLPWRSVDDHGIGSIVEDQQRAAHVLIERQQVDGDRVRAGVATDRLIGDL